MKTKINSIEKMIELAKNMMLWVDFVHFWCFVIAFFFSIFTGKNATGFQFEHKYLWIRPTDFCDQYIKKLQIFRE